MWDVVGVQSMLVYPLCFVLECWLFSDGGGSHFSDTQSGLTPGFVLRDNSWQCMGDCICCLYWIGISCVQGECEPLNPWAPIPSLLPQVCHLKSSQFVNFFLSEYLLLCLVLLLLQSGIGSLCSNWHIHCIFLSAFWLEALFFIVISFKRQHFKYSMSAVKLSVATIWYSSVHSCVCTQTHIPHT